MTTSLCPVCENGELTRQASGALLCSHCHAQIVQGQLQCSNCGASSPIGIETCATCGEPLTLFGRIMNRQGFQSRSHRLEQMRSQANAIKEAARLSSEARMGEFAEIDRQRIENERAERDAQEQRDRQLFRNLAIGVGIFLLIIAAISLVILL